jgi:hypothetical protein
MTVPISDPQPCDTSLGNDELSDESEAPCEEEKDEGDQVRRGEETLEEKILEERPKEVREAVLINTPDVVIERLMALNGLSVVSFNIKTFTACIRESSR